MKAVWKLLMLPARRMPVGAAIVWPGFVIALVAMAWMREPALAMAVGIMTWFWHTMTGFTLRSLLRPDTLLLPHLRRHLAAAAAVDIVVAVVLPTLLVAAIGGSHVLLTGALLALAVALGVASGTGLRAALLFWVIFVAVGWLPRPMLAAMQNVLDSPLPALAVLLIAALMLSMALRPLLNRRDVEADESPMQAMADGRKPQPGSDGLPRPRTALARRMAAVMEWAAQRAMDSALVRFRRRPGGIARLRLVRTLLLPHDGPLAIALRLVTVSLFITFYIVATHAVQRWDARYVGAYALMIGVGRFAAVGRGMLRMRPNLADLYMTLAPDTRSEFQAVLADVLLWLVAVVVFNCVAYAAVIAVLLHAAQPGLLLTAVAVTALGGAWAGLAVHLVGPESNTGRTLAQIVLMIGLAGVYALVYWLLARLGMGIGTPVALLVTLPFGIGAWRAARTEYLRRPPRFEAPAG